MKPRHLLARIAAFVTAAAAIGMFLGPARADASDHDDPDGIVNRDATSAMAPESLLEGWATWRKDFELIFERTATRDS